MKLGFATLVDRHRGLASVDLLEAVLHERMSWIVVIQNNTQHRQTYFRIEPVHLISALRVWTQGANLARNLRAARLKRAMIGSEAFFDPSACRPPPQHAVAAAGVCSSRLGPSVDAKHSYDG
jgi:hypothetical protein